MIERIDVDGIPAFVGKAPGPMRAGLMFRVGQVDETLPRRGITHLLEHLVLYPLGTSDYHYNGVTGEDITQFVTQGNDRDVSEFLNQVSDSLQRLALERMEIEKSIIWTESNARSRSEMPIWRHGARDYGLTSYPEWGLHAISAQDLLDWSARYFTRDNAVLWFSGDHVPEGLRLTLPRGQRHPVPTASNSLPKTPAYFTGSDNSATVNLIVNRGTAESVFARLLDRALFRNLRQIDGVSYVAQAEYLPRGASHALITGYADALPEKHGALFGGFLDTLAALRLGVVSDEDVTSLVAQAKREILHADASPSWASSKAYNELVGFPNNSIEELLAELETVTVPQIQQIAIAASQTALLSTPSGFVAEWAGYAPAPQVSESAVQGTAFPGIGERSTLVAGPEGVSLVDDDGRAVTVRYADCVAALAWPDGAIRFVDHDGFSVMYEPSLHQNAQHLSLGTDLPRDRWIPMPARKPEDVPQPVIPAKETLSGRLKRAASSELVWLVAIGAALILVTTFAASWLVIASRSDNDNISLAPALYACFGVVALGRLFYWRWTRSTYSRRNNT